MVTSPVREPNRNRNPNRPSGDVTALSPAPAHRAPAHLLGLAP